MLRMFWRHSGWKDSEFCRFVIKRVFVGFAGCVRGGRFERSSLREPREPREDDRDLMFGLEGSDKLAVANGLRLGLSIVLLFNLWL